MGSTALILASFALMAEPPPHPLHLEIDKIGDELVIKLVGESPVAVSASYELEVSGGAGTSDNRSVQRGTAAILPRHPVLITTLRLSDPKGANYAARLRVTPSGAQAYDLQWRSAPLKHPGL